MGDQEDKRSEIERRIDETARELAREAKQAQEALGDPSSAEEEAHKTAKLRSYLRKLLGIE
jgi:hypothetical protein